MSVTTAAAEPRPLIPALAPLYRALAPLGEPMIRITAGLLLMPHGAQKLFGWFGGGGLAGTMQYFETKVGMPGSMAVVVALIEFVGGALLALGLLTRVAAALIAGFLFTAVMVHLPKGLFWTAGGFEYPLLWGVVALAFVLRGGGRYSVDHAIGREI